MDKAIEAGLALVPELSVQDNEQSLFRMALAISWACCGAGHIQDCIEGLMIDAPPFNGNATLFVDSNGSFHTGTNPNVAVYAYGIRLLAPDQTYLDSYRTLHLFTVFQDVGHEVMTCERGIPPK